MNPDSGRELATVAVAMTTKHMNNNEARPDLAESFGRPMALLERLLAQRRQNRNRLCALHAPGVGTKGKAHKKYEFGAKVAVGVTNCEGLVVRMQTHAANPYDGQTLAPALVPGRAPHRGAPKRRYVDRGYRGHQVDGGTKRLHRRPAARDHTYDQAARCEGARRSRR
jgi:IS5 family transposase